MKNFKKVLIIFLVIFVLFMCFYIYSNISKASDYETNLRGKTLSEIKYLESKIIYIFNSLNNIEFENYKLSVEDISEKSKKSSQSSSSAGSSSGDEAKSSDKGSSKDDTSSGDDNSISKTKKYSLNAKGVLTNKDTINWDYIKNETELLQESLSTIMLDLYEISLNNNDILNFNKEYDDLNKYDFISIEDDIPFFGVLLKKKNINMENLIHGGKSTTKYRSGTSVTPLIVSFSKLVKLKYKK